MNRSIRIVHVVYSFDKGGMEKGIAMLVNHAAPIFQHLIVCTGRSGSASRLIPPSTRIVEMNKAPGHSLRFLLTLSASLKALGPDVVHTRNWSGMDGIVAARLAGIRNVIQGEHGWGVEDPHGENLKRILVRRLLARWVDQFTCVSKQMIGWLRESVGIQKPITQIYNGVDTAIYRPGPPARSLRDELELPHGKLVLGTVGRLDPIKDYPSLFRAFASLRKDFPETELVVVGDGAERARLERLSVPGIRILGDRDDVPDLLRLFDIFVLPSINEGISNTILEAMATAKPVVATRVGGNLELVRDGETGCCVRPRNSNELAAALAAYASNVELRRQHGDTARRIAIEEFSIATMVAKYEGIYRHLARSGPRGTPNTEE